MMDRDYENSFDLESSLRISNIFWADFYLSFASLQQGSWFLREFVVFGLLW